MSNWGEVYLRAYMAIKYWQIRCNKGPCGQWLGNTAISCLLHSIAAKHGMHGVTITPCRYK